jgi:hypothetical protein
LFANISLLEGNSSKMARKLNGTIKVEFFEGHNPICNDKIYLFCQKSLPKFTATLQHNPMNHYQTIISFYDNEKRMVKITE